MVTAGIDMGAKNIKIVILDGRDILCRKVEAADIDRKATAKRMFQEALDESGVKREDVSNIVATGSSKKAADFADKDSTIVSCNAAAIAAFYPTVKTIIDVGAEESLAIKSDKDGKVINSAVNEKCAAGSGAFVEAMARAMQVALEEFSELSLKSDKTIPMNAQCAIFAESEVVSLVHEETARMDICRSVHDAMAARIIAMVRRIGIEKDVAVIGGTAQNKGLLESLKREIGEDIDLIVPEAPTFTGALGAALIAQR